MAQIVDAEHGFAVDLPEHTPGGAVVSVDSAARDGRHRLHAATADGSTVYVEIVSGPGLVDHAAAASEQIAFLGALDPVASIGLPVPGLVAGRQATTFEFAGEIDGQRRTRRFAFFDAGGRTFRIVIDPRSELNDRIVHSLELPPDPRED